MAARKAKSSGDTASKGYTPGRPEDLTKPALCATLLAYGLTRQEVANAASISSRTLDYWTASAWWHEAEAAAPKLHRDADVLLRAAMGCVLKELGRGGPEASARAWLVLRAMIPELREERQGGGDGDARPEGSAPTRVTMTLEQLGLEGARALIDAARGSSHGSSS